MKHLLSILFAAVLVLSTAVSIQAQEPDRIVSALQVAGIAPLDQPVYVPTGAVDVVVDTTLLCTPPPEKVGCGVIVGMILHAPVDGDYPVYSDVLDTVASFECGDQVVPACQAGPGDSTRTFTFSVPKAGVYTLEVFTVVGFDYNPEDLRLTSTYPVLHEGAVYDHGSIYTVRGFALVVVQDLKVA